MSLLTSTNAGSASVSYFIENIGGPGSGVGDAPCIKGSTLGTVLVGDPANGLRLRGDTVANANLILGGQAAGGSLTIGNSVASQNNIVLTDAATTVNTPLTIAGGFGVVASGDLSTAGNLVFTGNTGKAISGYYTANVAVAGAGAVPNPAGLTAGVYFVVYVGNGAGNENAQPSGVFYWNALGGWNGNAVSFNFTAGAPNCALGPVAGGATLNIGGAGVPGAGTVYFRKIMN